MKDQDLLIDQVRNWHFAKEISEEIVKLDRVFLCDLAFEAIHLIHVLGLMVSSTQVHGPGQSHFPHEQSQDALDRPASSVYKVSIKQIGVRLTGVAIQLVDVQQIIVLPMDISAHCNLLIIRQRDVNH